MYCVTVCASEHTINCRVATLAIKQAFLGLLPQESLLHCRFIACNSTPNLRKTNCSDRYPQRNGSVGLRLSKRLRCPSDRCSTSLALRSTTYIFPSPRSFLSYT